MRKKGEKENNHMKKLLFYASIWVLVTLLMPSMPFGVQEESAAAQSQPTFTTLNANMADQRTQTLVVVSNTGFTASNTFLGTDYYVFVDQEAMRITAVSGTTITVQRGQLGTNAATHAKGAFAFVGVAPTQLGPATGQSGSPFLTTTNWGSCTRSSASPILPLIQINPAEINGQALYDCLNGVWTPGALISVLPQQSQRYCSVPVGSVAFGSFGTDTAGVAGTEFVNVMDLPQSFVATGLSALSGGTTTSNTVIVAIYDGGGNLIGNSVSTGTTIGTTNVFTDYNFTKKLVLVGPHRYFITVQLSGTDHIRTVATATFQGLLTTSIVGTAGTIPATITAPTTFTADKGPIACLF
jgi:hypothetical protein